MRYWPLILTVILLCSPVCADVTAVYFKASYCKPCQALRPALRRLQRQYSIREVDAGTANADTERYAISTIPVIVFKVGGKEIDRIVGAGRNWETRSAERLSGRNNWRPLRSAVRVWVSSGVGSGVILSSEAGNTVIATAAHIVSGHKTATVDVFADIKHERFAATVEATHIDNDLAILRIATNRYPLPSAIGSTGATIRQGDVCFGVGCSGGRRPSVLTSRVDGIEDGSLFCSPFPAQGRSGGGLFDRRFELIGICAAQNKTRNDGWYIGEEKVRELLSQWQPAQYRYRSRTVGVGVGLGFTQCVPVGPCNNPNCPNCRPVVGTAGPRGPQGIPGVPGLRGATGPAGRDGINADLSGLVQRIEALERAKRRVVLVDGKTGAVIDDESYGIEDPIVLDVQQLTKQND